MAAEKKSFFHQHTHTHKHKHNKASASRISQQLYLFIQLQLQWIEASVCQHEPYKQHFKLSLFFYTLSTVQWATPFDLMPSWSAATGETSRMRPATKGPRSLMRTVVVFPPTWARTCVPNGSVLWAAVRACELKRSPLAVRAPSRPTPYQLQMPDSPAKEGNRGWF